MMPNTPSQFGIYFDDAPIDSKSIGRGLHQINARALVSIQEHVDLVMVNSMRVGPKHAILEPTDGTPILRLLEGAKGVMVRAAGHLRNGVPDILHRIGFADPRISPSLGIRDLFASVGTDMGSTRRALHVAKRIGARLHLYMVDDPIDHLRRDPGKANQLERQRVDLISLLRQCETVFAISKPLADLLANETGRNAHFLPLPYFYDEEISCNNPKNQIIYIGSVNNIYQAELEYWIKLCKDFGYFSSGGQILITGDIPERPGVVRMIFDSSEDLFQEIANSRACLLPLSSKESDLCFSSFPSKLLDYLGYCRLILVSAPERAVGSQYMQNRSLPAIFPESAVPEKELMALLASNANYLADYRRALDADFSSASFCNRVRKRVAA